MKGNTPIASNDNKHRFYVYAWQYPDGRTFYIGKGHGSRDRRPKHKGNKLFNRIVAKIRRQGGEPRVVRWQEGLREEDAFKLEASYIKLFGRRGNGTGVLANLTDGGEGAVGLVHSAETRAKMRESHLGSKHSAEHCSRISEGKRGATREPFSEEWKHNIGAYGRLLAGRGLYKGVTYDKRRRKWFSRIGNGGGTTHLGTYRTPEEAARAYDVAAYAAWGDDCYLNFGPPPSNDGGEGGLCKLAA